MANEPQIDPLGPRTLRDQIADRIREAILRGTLSPGERLVERSLAERFETSLSAVREALVELESQGLVIRRRNATTHVVNLSPDDVDKIFRVRRALEALAVEEAARHADTEQVATIRRIFSDMERCAEDERSDRFNELIVEFHRRVWEASDNAFLVQALERTVLLYFRGNRMNRTTLDETWEEYTGSVLESHLGTLEAIEDHDPDRARRSFDVAFEGWYARALESRRRTSDQPAEREAAE